MHSTMPNTPVTLSKALLSCTLLLGSLFNVHSANALTLATPQSDQPWTFTTDLAIDPLNISGIVVTADFMALGSDEGSQIELFTPVSTEIDTKSGAKTWQSHQVITLDNSIAALKTELDIEGLAWQAPYLYAIGSHSVKRDTLKDNLSEKKNLIRLQTVSREPARQQLFRIELDRQFKAVKIESLSLAEELKKHPTLGLFTDIPSKENGVDIEGLSIDVKGQLLIGLRGPVLRGNIATVLRLKLATKDFKIKSLKTLYLPLAGRGIRGLSEMSDNREIDNGLLVLTGAVGDQDLSYQVYHWNGETNLPSKSVNKKSLRLLCELPASLGKPEGIQFLQKNATSVEFIIVEDGVVNGQPKVFTCPL